MVKSDGRKLLLALAAAASALLELGSSLGADKAGQIAAVSGLGLIGGAAIRVGNAIQNLGLDGLAFLDIPELCLH